MSDIILKPGDRVQWEDHGSIGTVVAPDLSAYPVWVRWDRAKVDKPHPVP